MQEIDFEDKKTSLSAATFSAFQRNVKNAFKNYKIGQYASFKKDVCLRLAHKKPYLPYQ